ncbi:hypothetical protein [Nocardia cyriacigeorgica]|uniref:hypothetical protein n=1 Tax=Nocardia cyriacigeorgica TaxID=135487 RepID=UPI002455E289|nr:hypothetical protein [Nocardia cyriacigeorgica]
MSTSEFFDPADSVRHRSCIQAGSLGVAILGGDSARWSHRHARASPSRDDGSLDGQRIDPPKKPPTLLAVQFDDAPPEVPPEWWTGGQAAVAAAESDCSNEIGAIIPIDE